MASCGRAFGRGGVGLGIAGIAVASLMLGAPLRAQEEGGLVAPGTGLTDFPVARQTTPLLTLDQERLFTASRFGRRIAAEVAAASEELARQNRAIEAELTAEERDLTERRAELGQEAFRTLADAFDKKVVRLRRVQDGKARALQRRDEIERQVFLRAALPILAELVAELGAVAILDDRAVLFAAETIDVTGRAIGRIDARIGAGEGLSPPEPILPPDEAIPLDDMPLDVPLSPLPLEEPAPVVPAPLEPGDAE
ncbi:MAG: OmpH family outer membrane protein [Pseudomonadota bacterium]